MGYFVSGSLHNSVNFEKGNPLFCYLFHETFLCDCFMKDSNLSVRASVPNGI